MAGAEIGKVWIRVVPLAKSFRADLKKTLEQVESTLKVTLQADIDAESLVASARRAVTAAEAALSGVDIKAMVDAQTEPQKQKSGGR